MNPRITCQIRDFRLIRAAKCVCLATGLLFVSTLDADELKNVKIEEPVAAKPKADLPKSKQPASKRPADIQLDDKQVRAFVKEHHAELDQLLDRLQKDSPVEYAKAIDETRGIAERVARYQNRMPKRAEYEIARWKVDSRVRLLTARMVSLMAEPVEGVEHPDLEAARVQLHELAEQRVQLEIDRIEADRRALTERLKSLESQAERFNSDRQAVVDKQFQTLTKSVESAARKRGVAAMKGEKRENDTPSSKNGNKKPASDVSEKKPKG